MPATMDSHVTREEVRMLAMRRLSQAVRAEERVDMEWVVRRSVPVRMNVNGTIPMRIKL